MKLRATTRAKRIVASYNKSFIDRPHPLKLYRDTVVDTRKRRLETADEFKDATFATETSVANNGGTGLYALCTMHENSYLPFPYPGKSCSHSSYNALNDLLVMMTTEIMSKVATDAIVSTLKSRWGIEIRDAKRAWGTLGINWDALYDSFIAYGYDTKDEMHYWHIYWDYGDVAITASAPSHSPLFINEPPPYETFVNRLTERNQKSECNVEFIEGENNTVWVRVLRTVHRGDELLAHYGAFYKRNYAINMTDVALPVATTPEDQKLLDAYVLAQANYKPLGKVFKAEQIEKEQYLIAFKNALMDALGESNHEEPVTPVTKMIKRTRV